MESYVFDYKHFKEAGELFLRQLCRELAEVEIFAEKMEADHLCFRVSNQEEYDFYKRELELHGQLLTEALVNGRAICTFLLYDAFKTECHTVKLIELPAPKKGTTYNLGFEHAEFVLHECFSEFAFKFPKLSFRESGNPVVNPELCLTLGEKQGKFHYLSLDRVIEIENAEIKHIIFDLDGTLIRSRETIYEINRIVFSEILEREVTIQESIEKFHPEFSKLFDAFSLSCTSRRNLAVSRWGSVSERFTYALFDGVSELLNDLSRAGFHLHLWTAREEHSARNILTAHGLEHFFSSLNFATHIDSKPKASSLRMDWEAIDKNQIIVVGDSPSDIKGAKNIRAIGAAALWDSHAQKSLLVDAGAELFFHQLSDFRDWLKL